MTEVTDLRSSAKNEMSEIVRWQTTNLLDPSYEDMKDWLQKDVVDSDVKLIPQYFHDIGRCFLGRYVASGFDSLPEGDLLAISCKSALSGFLCEVPVYDFHPNNLGYYRIDEYGFLLAQLIVAGWKEEAELVARLGFVEINRLMDRGITSRRVPWFMLELAKDWLQADVSLNTVFREEEIKDLGVWQKLLSGWRTSGESSFDALMSELAEYHISQSREAANDDEVFEFEDVAYWLFPVELLAVIRLREWLNIPHVTPTHSLFSATPLGKLYAAPKLPSDKILDAVEQKFRAIYPETPSVKDLKNLRNKQK